MHYDGVVVDQTSVRNVGMWVSDCDNQVIMPSLDTSVFVQDLLCNEQYLCTS